ncbi:MAG: hypothetical protein A2007_05645 [Verrucomicrobia bacterium GWC2_42_7]|nr:MAG: hypothetical protein A2007_05645 [Verrucomicrobia bacterium GWC2_42_7]
MRASLIRNIYNIAEKDANLLLITGDLGFGFLDDFQSKLKDQFINAGIAEQNLIGVATGLSLSGYISFCYSIGNFLSLRCLEQIRNDVSYHDANVKIVSVGGGFSYGPLGVSHHCLEDLAIMRAIPNLSVAVPGSKNEAREIARIAYQEKGPFYIRLEREGFEEEEIAEMVFGKIRPLSNKGEIAILGCGGILGELFKAKQILERKQPVSLYSIPFLRPFDEAFIRQLAMEKKYIITVEEGLISGGLGGSVCEVVSQMDSRKAKVSNIGVPHQFCYEVGDQMHLRKKYGLDANSLAQQIMNIIS